MNKQVSLLQECLGDIQRKHQGKSVDPLEFQRMFCKFCRNPDCVHAGWAADQFSMRVAQQPERFFHPTQIDAAQSSKYAGITDFTDKTNESIQLHIANVRKDWEVPEIAIKDGVSETAVHDTTTSVDDAAMTLSRSKEKHLTIASPETREVEFPEPESEPSPAPKKPTPAPSTKPILQGNTPNSPHGIMIGGEKRKPAPVVDPWAAPKPKKDKVVEPGARIKLGGDTNAE